MILVVDDNVLSLQLLQDNLKELGIEHVCTTSATEAIKIASTVILQLILLDLQLPDQISGTEVGIQIRRLPFPFGDVPIIAMTGGIQTQDFERWPDAQFSGYLLKPFSVSDLEIIITGYARNV